MHCNCTFWQSRDMDCLTQTGFNKIKRLPGNDWRMHPQKTDWNIYFIKYIDTLDSIPNGKHSCSQSSTNMSRLSIFFMYQEQDQHNQTVVNVCKALVPSSLWPMLNGMRLSGILHEPFSVCLFVDTYANHFHLVESSLC